MTTALVAVRGFLPGGLSDAGPQRARIAVTGQHPKPYTEADLHLSLIIAGLHLSLIIKERPVAAKGIP